MCTDASCSRSWIDLRCLQSANGSICAPAIGNLPLSLSHGNDDSWRSTDCGARIDYDAQTNCFAKSDGWAKSEQWTESDGWAKPEQWTKPAERAAMISRAGTEPFRGCSGME